MSHTSLIHVLKSKSSDINICIKDIGQKSEFKQSNKNDLCASSEILADSFPKIKRARIENINNVITGNLNINSFPNKFHDLKVLVNGILDILMTTETKLDDTFPVSQFHINKFSKPYRLDRNRNGGGVAKYVREDIPSKILTKHVFTY